MNRQQSSEAGARKRVGLTKEGETELNDAMNYVHNHSDSTG